MSAVIDRFWTWVTTPVKDRGPFLFKTLLFLMVYKFGVVLVASQTTLEAPDPTKDSGPGIDFASGYGTIMWIMVGVVLIEELVRLLPLMLFAQQGRDNRSLLFVLVLLLGAAFGWVHYAGNNIPFWLSIAAQGVGGLVYNLVYLKTGGLHGDRVRGYTSSCFLHYMSNAVLIGIASLAAA